jgi:PST family polysaccharide transporter
LSTLRDWYGESVPLGVGDSIRHLILHTDTLLLAALRPAAQVGLFGVAYRPLQPLQLLPRTIVSVTFPGLSRAAHVDREGFSRTFAHTVNLLWIASLPICIVTATCATPLILATAGEQFAAAARPLQLLIWSTVLIFISAQLRFAFMALDEEQSYWRMIGYSLIVKVGLELALIWAWGLYGACAGYLLGEGLICAWGLKTLRSLNVSGPGWTQLARVIPAAAAMALVLVPLIHETSPLWMLALATVASSVVYVVVCVLSRALPWSDVMNIWQAVQRTTAVPTAMVVPADGRHL